ncbi:MAG: DUF6788 family protein [Egibacteraceae bacterium]
MQPGRRRHHEQRAIAQALSQIGFVLPGSVQVRSTRCGKPGCRCHADPSQPHGPYIVWTRKVADKTVTKVLTETQLAAYQPWFDNARQLRQLVSQLQTLSLQAFEEDDYPRDT